MPKQVSPTSISTIKAPDPYYVEAGELQKKFDSYMDTRHKYASIENATKANKIAALKNPSIDVHQLHSPTDALAASYNRWKTVAGDAAKRYNPEQQKTIASNYYKKDIASFYAKLGIQGPSEEEWLKQAYSPKGALGINVEDFYHSQLTSGIIRGLQSTAGQMESLGATTINMLGGITNWTEMHKPGDNRGWFERAEAATQSHDTGKTGNVFSVHVDKTGMPSLGAGPGMKNIREVMASDSKTFTRFADQDEFWQHVNPAKGFTDSVASFGTEIVATLPLFGAISAGNKTLGETALKVAPNLTRILGATARGKIVARALMAGGEGLAYGTLTRPNADKGQAKWDALSFMAMGTLFHFAGEKLTHRDLLSKNGDIEALKDHEATLEAHRMSAEEGKHIATPQERREAYIHEHATNMSQMGVVGQTKIYAKALAHMQEEEHAGMGEADVNGRKQKTMDEDPAAASPLYTARQFIKDVIGDKKVSELSQEEKIDLHYQIGQIINESEEHLNRAKGPIQEANVAHGKPDVKNPSTKITLATIKAKIMEKLHETGAINSVKPEQIDILAEKEFQEAQGKAASEAEKRRNRNPIGEAKDVAATRTEQAKIEGRKSGQVASTPSKSLIKSYTRGMGPSRSATHNVEYLNTVSAAAKAQGKTLSQFFEAMDSLDFEKDLETHFYPKELKEAGLYFEHEHTREGKQNPNFLAFMYNYKDQMPKEFAEKLDKELEESLKFEEHFKGYRITEPQKYHFALQMYNHVDTFLGSTSFGKGERNIFRSTQSDLLNPTKYQHELLGEMHAVNLKSLSEMFPNPREKTAARNAYKILAGELNAIFSQKPSIASAEAFRSKSDEIASHLVEKGEGSIIPWEF